MHFSMWPQGARLGSDLESPAGIVGGGRKIQTLNLFSGTLPQDGGPKRSAPEPLSNESDFTDINIIQFSLILRTQRMFGEGVPGLTSALGTTSPHPWDWNGQRGILLGLLPPSVL